MLDPINQHLPHSTHALRPLDPLLHISEFILYNETAQQILKHFSAGSLQENFKECSSFISIKWPPPHPPHGGTICTSDFEVCGQKIQYNAISLLKLDNSSLFHSLLDSQPQFCIVRSDTNFPFGLVVPAGSMAK